MPTTQFTAWKTQILGWFWIPRWHNQWSQNIFTYLVPENHDTSTTRQSQLYDTEVMSLVIEITGY